MRLKANIIAIIQGFNQFGLLWNRHQLKLLMKVVFLVQEHDYINAEKYARTLRFGALPTHLRCQGDQKSPLAPDAHVQRRFIRR